VRTLDIDKREKVAFVDKIDLRLFGLIQITHVNKNFFKEFVKIDTVRFFYQLPSALADGR
jgi:hypothetical protein